MWVPITLAAATFQVLRTSRQHRLRALLTLNGAGYVRYAYGFPLAVVASIVTFGAAGQEVPAVPTRFWPIVVGAGIAQIGGTVALLRSFDLRDFAIGTVYVKSEVILVAIVSAIALDEPLRPLGWMSVVVCVIGVVWLAARGDVRTVLSSAGDPAALMGVLAAAGFALAAVGIRAASTSLGDGSAWNRALLTLTVMLGVQSLLNGTQLAVTNRAELHSVYRNWRAALPVGILSIAGSAGWAVAVTLTNAAKVRTLGQVELLIAFAISAYWLHERHERSEYAASALVMIGVTGVVALG
jgi:drug/metabolite transporter (DMT)-like permease